MSKLQWSLATAAVAGLLAWNAVPPPDAAVDAPHGQRAVALTEPRNPVDLSTERRGLPARARDLFNTPPPPPPSKKSEPLPELVQAPQAPPLPYKYDGSGVVQGKSFVYLKRQDRSFMVSPGDTLEGTYSVEAVERDHAVLRYLPLGTRQVMMYQAGAEVPPGLAAAGPTRPLELQVDMPAEVVLGQEFVVSVVLPGAGALKATVEVGYDPEVLRMVGAGLPRPGGRAVVEVTSGSTPHAQLRFKVLADSPASTDIALQVNATDAGGKRVPVWTPKAHTVSLVHAGGA